MTDATKLIAGLLLIAITTIEFGGTFLLSVLSGKSLHPVASRNHTGRRTHGADRLHTARSTLMQSSDQGRCSHDVGARPSCHRAVQEHSVLLRPRPPTWR